MVRFCFALRRSKELIPCFNTLPKKARMNLAVRRPSMGPPGPIILATPFLRHFARPRDAENTEEKKVRKKNNFD